MQIALRRGNMADGYEGTTGMAMGCAMTTNMGVCVGVDVNFL